MNAADLARLEVAKRAYQAVQPSATEVQTGVRRARLSLLRAKSRRSWFSKGLVFVVLAVGSLAYAKPHALGELVERALPHVDAGAKAQKVRLAIVVTPTPDPTPKGDGGVHLGVAAPTNAERAPSSASIAAPGALEGAVAATDRDDNNAPKRTARLAMRAASSGAAPHAVSGAVTDTRADSTAAIPVEDATLSDWGRVGQALARGDEARALAALSALSESDDARTRDKADLGRAQLLMSHGNRDQGCALARSLTNRRAGSHIEREAQVLLQSCTR